MPSSARRSARASMIASPQMMVARHRQITPAPKRISLGTGGSGKKAADRAYQAAARIAASRVAIDRKSTRLNSSHRCISYAVFCLKKCVLTHLKRRHGHGGFYRSSGGKHVCEVGLPDQKHCRYANLFFFNYRGTPETNPFPPPDALPI